MPSHVSLRGVLRAGAAQEKAVSKFRQLAPSFKSYINFLQDILQGSFL
jgi:hypothetical protein